MMIRICFFIFINNNLPNDSDPGSHLCEAAYQMTRDKERQFDAFTVTPVRAVSSINLAARLDQFSVRVLVRLSQPELHNCERCVPVVHSTPFSHGALSGRVNQTVVS